MENKQRDKTCNSLKCHSVLAAGFQFVHSYLPRNFPCGTRRVYWLVSRALINFRAAPSWDVFIVNSKSTFNHLGRGVGGGGGGGRGKGGGGGSQEFTAVNSFTKSFLLLLEVRAQLSSLMLFMGFFIFRVVCAS